MHLIADYAQADKLLPFDRSALAALLTDSSRQAEDQSSLFMYFGTLESDFKFDVTKSA